MGTPSFAVPSLDIIHENGYEIPAVVTVPDKQKGRGLRTSFSDVKVYALEKGLKLLQPYTLNDNDFINEIYMLNPGLIVVVAFKILPPEIFTVPAYGSINLHASLLPKYRGAAPINRAIMKGETETGVTTFFLKEKVDTGNIILQKSLKINEEDDAGIIHDKLSVLGAETVLETIRMIEKGNVELKVQNDSEATSAPKIYKKDCLINWNSDENMIFNLIRGLSPYPAAFTKFKGRNVKIYKARRTGEDLKISPGKIEIQSKRLLAGTGSGAIEILELQLEGKKRIHANEFINGLNDKENLFFENIE